MHFFQLLHFDRHANEFRELWNSSSLKVQLPLFEPHAHFLDPETFVVNEEMARVCRVRVDSSTGKLSVRARRIVLPNAFFAGPAARPSQLLFREKHSEAPILLDYDYQQA